MTTDNGSAKDKEFDLVLFGATGFTGGLVAEYLVRRRPGIRWALAGRSRDKLERVRGALVAVDPAAGDLPLVVGDSLDAASVDAMVRRTRVVCTTVGPYALYGRALIGACAERGVHYCDLTGEAHFVRAAIDAHHARAVETGARIVPCCGADSIPSDLGVLMLHDHLARRGGRLAEAHFRVLKATGSFSGGTMATIMNMFEHAADPAVRRALSDPYVLYPEGVPPGSDRTDQLGPRRDPETGRWTAPFMMAAINTRIVRRSNALLGFAYGAGFRYDEAFDMGPGPRGLGLAVGMSVGLGAFFALGAIGPTRKLLSRFLPAPGEGPSREERERGSYRLRIHGVSAAGERLTGMVGDDRDPGYGGTAVMLGESALCLAEDDLPARGGVLTTASCMGMPLIERLRAAGMTLRVE